jgi:hypothetical protein
MRFFINVWILLSLSFYFLSVAEAQGFDPLPSWRDTSVKQAILHFVQSVTDVHNAHYVAEKDRIATIDNDGTLWVEQPIYTQIIFAVDRLKALAAQHPEWKNQTFFQKVVNQQYQQLTPQDYQQIFALTQCDMNVEAFNQFAKHSFAPLALSAH